MSSVKLRSVKTCNLQCFIMLPFSVKVVWTYIFNFYQVLNNVDVIWHGLQAEINWHIVVAGLFNKHTFLLSTCKLFSAENNFIEKVGCITPAHFI